LPERLELVKEFPMTNVGKIDKKELRRIIAEKLQKERKYNFARRQFVSIKDSSRLIAEHS